MTYVHAKMERILEIKAMELPRLTKESARTLRPLRGLSSYEEFQRARAMNVALVMSCKTKEELAEKFNSLDSMSAWITTEAAMIKTCGEAPDWMIGGAKNCPSLIMQARAKAKRQ